MTYAFVIYCYHCLFPITVLLAYYLNKAKLGHTFAICQPLTASSPSFFPSAWAKRRRQSCSWRLKSCRSCSNFADRLLNSCSELAIWERAVSRLARVCSAPRSHCSHDDNRAASSRSIASYPPDPVWSLATAPHLWTRLSLSLPRCFESSNSWKGKIIIFSHRRSISLPFLDPATRSCLLKKAVSPTLYIKKLILCLNFKNLVVPLNLCQGNDYIWEPKKRLSDILFFSPESPKVLQKLSFCARYSGLLSKYLSHLDFFLCNRSVATFFIFLCGTSLLNKESQWSLTKLLKLYIVLSLLFTTKSFFGSLDL